MEEELKSGKNKKIYLAIGACILLVGLFVLLNTYAFWRIKGEQSQSNYVVGACLNFEFVELKDQEDKKIGGFKLEGDNAMPMTDEEGSATPGYTFKIENTCDEPVNFQIVLESLKMKNEETANPDDYYPEEKYFDENMIKIQFDNGPISSYDGYQKVDDDSDADYLSEIRKTRELLVGTIGGKETQTHNLKMWISSESTREDIGKIFRSKIKVFAGQGITVDDCYTISSQGTLASYNPACGTSAIVPATVNGVRVKSIASDAFKTLSATYNTSLEDIETENGKQSDFSIFLSNKLIPLMGDNVSQEQQAAILSTATADDIWIVINHPELSDEKEAVLDDAIEAVFTELNAMDMLAVAGLEPKDFAIYKRGINSLPSGTNGAVEFVFEIINPTGNVGVNILGQRVPSSVSSVLSINSLDLSQATYLERIEERAFSNLPAWNSNTLTDVENIETGLTSLTFGDNTNAIYIGSGAFAGMNLDSLTIYNTLEYATLETDGETALFGPFSHSTIDSLTIAKAGDKTTYTGVGMKNFYYVVGFETEGLGEGIGQALAAMVALTLPQVTTQNVTFADGITSISSSDFTISNSLTLPNDLQEVGSMAFMGYSGSSLNLPSTVTKIGYYAFGNYNGTSLTIPDSVTSIGSYAFQNYNGNNFTIPHSVTTIDDYAFSQFEGTVTIDNSPSNINLADHWLKEGNEPVFTQN